MLGVARNMEWFQLEEKKAEKQKWGVLLSRPATSSREMFQVIVLDLLMFLSG
jgi:hypothetical protein